MPDAPHPGGFRRRRRRRGGRGRRRNRAPKIALEPINLKEVLESAPLLAYCRDCRRDVPWVLVGTKVNCSACKGLNVAFGSPVSVRNYFRLSPEASIRRKRES